jgi:drug/metabolite transporter (DMT)-like permease
MIIPVLVSVFFYKEPIGVLRLLGICMTVVALCVNVNKEKSNEYKKWFLFCLFASLTNGALAVCQQIFGKTEWKDQTQSFVAWSYIIATVFSMFLYLFFRAKGDGITFKIKPSVFLYSLSVGVILGVFQFINTKAIANIDGTLLFPTYNAGTLILSTLSSILILKDKLTNNQKISLFIGVAAIVLMNI